MSMLPVLLMALVRVTMIRKMIVTARVNNFTRVFPTMVPFLMPLFAMHASTSRLEFLRYGQAAFRAS